MGLIVSICFKMKILFFLAVLLAIASCQIYPMYVGNQCSLSSCPRSYWTYNNINYNYTCPKTGSGNARFRLNGQNYVLDFIANNSTSYYSVQLPLIYNKDAKSNGIQYFQPLQTDTFVVLNCTIPAAKKYTNLCSRHALVGGKIIKSGAFQNSCAFGLDAPKLSFLQQEQNFELESLD
ncbi:transmembrane protein, putative (macronuclear) [Tetrahymena thermophila SB210]|uniref:Transmembrane protein, putative n=1 Tax=Tetrahymena thermophila (strain SB210) TaxID=312017 RepID=Q232J1_TETTS|nr:transmembrane protein, putative [Tetrahymena thermophila SB210]EAR91421.2 transmembrane protein, putative [Tetrahymena thermophila SB210]|eukprot:XP_001011666.2 transmembrane protein, putative [Tetrahymena thermophila SB210]